MQRSQWIAGSLALALLAGGCQRNETGEPSGAAAEVRGAAELAGSRLADSWLTSKIQAQYFADDDVKARYVTVTTNDGVVTLTGRVDDRNARDQAVEIARNTDGVRHVVEHLTVGPPEGKTGRPEQADPAWITTQIQARFFADSDIGHRDIQVRTHDGVVTLTGRVGSALEEQQALAIAHDIEGVERVDDQITVAPPGASVGTTGAPGAAPATVAPPDDSRITTAIQAKYFLDNALKGRRIQVSSRQGVVTLQGEVGSDDERAQALLLAQTTEGVERVEDALAVDVGIAP